MQLEELKRLLSVDSKAILSQRIDPLGTEYDVVKAELNAMRYLRLSNRVVEIPGLSRNLELIIACVAEVKAKTKRNVMPLQFAKSDDIVVMPIRCEHIGANFVDEQDVTIPPDKYTASFNILPRGEGAYTVPPDQRFIFTDFIELYSPASTTAIRIADVDGTPQYALDATLAFKATDLRIFELPHPVIADASFDIDGKVESKIAGATVTTAIRVIGVWIGFGKDVPPLVR